MSKFVIGDRVEFTPTREDTAYPGDLEQYLGQQGTIVEASTDGEDAFFDQFFGPNSAIVAVDWDEAFMRNATTAEYPEDERGRASFAANLTTIDGEA